MAVKSPLGGADGGGRFTGMPQRGESSTALLNDGSTRASVGPLSTFRWWLSPLFSILPFLPSKNNVSERILGRSWNRGSEHWMLGPGDWLLGYMRERIHGKGAGHHKSYVARLAE